MAPVPPAFAALGHSPCPPPKWPRHQGPRPLETCDDPLKSCWISSCDFSFGSESRFVPRLECPGSNSYAERTTGTSSTNFPPRPVKGDRSLENQLQTQLRCTSAPGPNQGIVIDHVRSPQ